MRVAVYQVSAETPLLKRQLKKMGLIIATRNCTYEIRLQALLLVSNLNELFTRLRRSYVKHIDCRERHQASQTMNKGN